MNLDEDSLVIVVRHGERIDEVDRDTWRNMKDHGVVNPNDPPLTATGKDQSITAGSHIKERLIAEGIDVNEVSLPVSHPQVMH